MFFLTACSWCLLLTIELDGLSFTFKELRNLIILNFQLFLQEHPDLQMQIGNTLHHAFSSPCYRYQNEVLGRFRFFFHLKSIFILRDEALQEYYFYGCSKSISHAHNDGLQRMKQGLDSWRKIEFLTNFQVTRNHVWQTCVFLIYLHDIV